MWNNKQNFEGGGWVMYKSSPTENMNILGLELVSVIIMVLLITSGYFGNLGSDRKEFFIEVNMFTSPYYNIGISFNCVYEDEFQSIEQLTIGLYFINFNLVFYKEVA